MIRLKTLLDHLAYGVSLLGFLPLFAHLEAPARIVFPAALLIGALCDRRGNFPFKPSFTTVLTLAVFLFYVAQIGRDYLVEPVVNLLVLLMAVRLISGKGGREYLQIFLLAVFSLAASSLFDLSIVFLLYLIPMILTVTAGLILLTFHHVEPGTVFNRMELRRVGSMALLLPTLSLGLMLLLFFILPRTHQPLWHFLPPAATAAGLSDRVVPGSSLDGGATGRTVFRVQTPRLPPGELYWRGIVLNTVEGSAWVRREPAAETARVRGGREVRQTFFPEPRPEGFVPTLELPGGVKGIRHRPHPDLVFAAPGSDRRVRYDVVSHVGGTLEAIGAVERDFYLQLPQEVSPRVAQAAAAVADKGDTDRERIAALEGFFLSLALSYSLEARHDTEDPVDHFLFVTRQGYCEYFAASFALMLRLSGVPARLVGGYLGGHYNDLGGYYLVTEEAAHLWVEALVDGKEWVRLDPTRLARNAEAAALGGRMGTGRGFIDAVDYFWSRLVIAYDLQSQVEVVRKTTQRARLWRLERPQAGKGFWGGFAALILASSLYALKRRKSREERIVRRYFKEVQRHYGAQALTPAMGLDELAGRLDDPACRQFAHLYGRAVYRDRALSANEFRRLRRIIREIGKNAR